MASISAPDFPINALRSLFISAGTVGNLRDPTLSYFHHLPVLNRRIEQISGEADAKDVFLKGIWKQFYTSICSAPSAAAKERMMASLTALQEHFPKSQVNLGPFADTDLLVFNDDYQGPMPINGLKKAQFAVLLNVYAVLQNHLTIEGDETFQRQILKDLRTLLTRPLGRELITEIAFRMQAPDQQIVIRSSDESAYYPAPEGDPVEIITHRTDPQYILQILPNKEEASVRSPSFINLGHELLHLLHHLKNEYIHTDSYDADPTVPRLDTNREERRTIYGNCGTRQAIPCHRNTHINENALRSQFIGLLQRTSHHSGIAHVGCAKCNYVFAVRHGIRDNIRATIRNVSDNTLNAAVIAQMQKAPTPTTPNPHTGVSVVIEEALRDRSLRRGPFLSTLRTPAVSDEAAIEARWDQAIEEISVPAAPPSHIAPSPANQAVPFGSSQLPQLPPVGSVWVQPAQPAAGEADEQMGEPPPAQSASERIVQLFRSPIFFKAPKLPKPSFNQSRKN